MIVEMRGGPQDGKLFTGVRKRAIWLYVREGGVRYKVPIRFSWLNQKFLAEWNDRERA